MCSTPFGIIGILTALVPTLLFVALCKSVFAHLFVSLSHLVLSTLAVLLFVSQSPKNQTLKNDASMSTAILPNLTLQPSFVSAWLPGFWQSTTTDACVALRKVKWPRIIKPGFRSIMQPHVPLADIAKTQD